MKKIWLFIVFSLFFLVVTGCESNLNFGGMKKKVCTYTEELGDGNTGYSKVVISYKDNLVKELDYTLDSTLEDIYIDDFYNQVKGYMDEYDEIDGIDADVERNGTNITMEIEIEIDELDFDSYNKTFADADLFDGFNSKKIYIDEFIDSLEGYTCK